MTEKEFDSLPTRLQEQVRRYAASSANQSWQQYYSPQPTPTQFRRVGKSRLSFPLVEVNVCADLETLSHSDWLRERVFFDKLIRKDGYSKARLGYSAPNIFVLSLSNY